MILVIGGAGYMGSHVVNLLLEKGPVVVYDNLSTGHRGAIDERAIFIEGDLSDQHRLTQVFALFPVHAVFHFAASDSSGEAMENPEYFYDNNVAGTLALLKVMRACRVKNLVFSSAAACGQETEQLQGQNKMEPDQSASMIERMLKDYANAYDMHCKVLRYKKCSAASAAAHAKASGNPEALIYGERFAASDGTGIRDFSYLTAVANAHVEAYEALQQGGSAFAMCDIAAAGSGKNEQELGWQAEQNVQQMMEDAWNWHRNSKC